MTAHCGREDDGYGVHELLRDKALIEEFLAGALGPVDRFGYYGRRPLEAGLSVAVIPLTFARARLVIVDDASSCPLDGW